MTFFLKIKRKKNDLCKHIQRIVMKISLEMIILSNEKKSEGKEANRVGTWQAF